ncbi:T9SS type A sorting domain-containing protein, partial [bacterium]|nr:T9SS type A sorting domain-containing protein [bacterium]
VVRDGAKIVAASSDAELPIVFQGVESGAGNWFGIRLETLASAQTGYGFLACSGDSGDFNSGCGDERSGFENVAISDSEFGLSIEGNVAPQIIDVSFQYITDERDIYLANGDVVLPIDFEWRLKAPTRVVAADIPDSTVQDHSYGTEDRSDLLVEGLLITGSDDPGTDWVSFGPEAPDVDEAEEWGGVFLKWGPSGRLIEDAEFSYAENPLYVYWPGWDGTTTIRNCWIHHFADIGLWVHGTLGSDGAIIDSSLVERGSTLDELLGRVGVYLDQVDQLAFEGNTVRMELSGGFPPSADYSRAVEAAYGKTPCMSEPSAARTLSITANTLEGPGENTAAPTGGTSGLYSNTQCGGTNRTIEVTYNEISGFNYAGLEFNRSSDVQVSCNAVTANVRGIEFTRQLADSGFPGVRFLTNLFETSADHTGLVRTDLVKKTKIGGISTKGFNVLRTKDDGTTLTPFILENEDGDANTLNATHNWWFKTDTLLVTEAQIDVPALIWTELPDTTVSNPEDRPQVNVSSFNTTGGTSGCWENVGARVAGRPIPATATSGVAEERGAKEAAVSADLPRVTRISAPYPNPSSGVATISLEVSRDRAGRYRAEVYDVAGRSVAVLVDRIVDAGRYDLRWSGRVNGGGVAAPGVYFVRVTGPGFHRNARLVVLR